MTRSSIALFACLSSLLGSGAAHAQVGGVSPLIPPAARFGYPPAAYPLAPAPLLGPWGACAHGNCVDSPALRAAIRRELQRQELRNDLDRQAEAAARVAEQTYRVPRYLPPATPESQVQPGYRGSGEVRLEYRASGVAR